MMDRGLSFESRRDFLTLAREFIPAGLSFLTLVREFIPTRT